MSLKTNNEIHFYFQLVMVNKCTATIKKGSCHLPTSLENYILDYHLLSESRKVSGGTLKAGGK